MPIIYTYPSATPSASDLLIFSDVSVVDPQNATRKCTIQAIIDLIGALVPGGGTVQSVGFSTGTTGLTVSSDTTNPITATGTFTLAGTLQADNGGTGQSTYTKGDILYYNATSTQLEKLGIGGASQVLTVSGGGLPSWSAVTAGTVTSVNASGGTTGITFSGGPVTGSGTLTMSGTLVVANGGTGVASFNTNSVIVNGGTATGPLTDSGALANGKLVIGRTGNSPIAGSITSTGGTVAITEGSGTINLETSVTGMTQWTLAGNTGPAQVVANTNTATIVGGSNINTVASATRNVTVNWAAPTKTNYDNTLALRGSGGGTIAAGAFTTNTAAYYEIGDFMYVEFYLEWTTAAGAGLVNNLILTVLPKVAYQTGGAIDNGNCVIHLNDNLGRGAANEAPTTGWVAKTGVGTEMTFRSCDSATHVFEDYNYDQRLIEGSPAYKLAGTITYMVNVHA